MNHVNLLQSRRRPRSTLPRRLAAVGLVIIFAGHLGLPSLAAFVLPNAVEAAEEPPTVSGQMVELASLTQASNAASEHLTTAVAPPAANIRPGGQSAAPAASVGGTYSPPPVSAAGSLTWLGTAGQEAYVRTAPTRSAPRVRTLAPGEPVQVLRWVSGEEIEKENTAWAQIGDEQYVFSTLLRSAALEGPPRPPADAPTAGRWIDVNVTLQVATAYEGRTPLRWTLVSTGQPAWETPLGTFKIQRRLEKETMDGATLKGQGPSGAGATYKVENVRWTQYFSADGSAIHENYWRNPATFGMPGSHGCIGMRPADAAWFWEFATYGTPIVIHTA